MIRSVIFDVDGVLIDSEAECLKCYQKAGREYDYDFTLEMYHQVSGGSFQDMPESFYEKYGLTGEKKNLVLNRGHQLSQERFTRPIQMKPNVKKILDALHQEGLSCYIGSTTQRSGIEERLSPWNLIPCFQGIVSGDMVKHRKPAPDTYLLCLEKFSLNPKETVVIEDSINGVLSAHAAGLRVICVPDLWPMDEYAAKGYCMIAHSLQEALEDIEWENKAEKDESHSGE